jgi:ATP-dependent exoDNAse (exonuclease V) alpha subunit
VTQVVTVRVVKIRVVVQRVHLMHTHPRQLACVRVERVERVERIDECTRLAVRERNDDVRALNNVLENGLGRRYSSGHSDDRILPAPRRSQRSSSRKGS